MLIDIQSSPRLLGQKLNVDSIMFEWTVALTTLRIFYFETRLVGLLILADWLAVALEVADPKPFPSLVGQ